MNRNICRLIDENYWFQEGMWENLELSQYSLTYQILEAVFLNVAARLEKCWKELYYATPKDEELFSELCVATIIIEKALIKYHGYTEKDIITILGYRLMDNVMKYRNLKAKISLHS